MVTVNPGSVFWARRDLASSGWLVAETLPRGAVPPRGDPDRAILGGLTEEAAEGIAVILNEQRGRRP